MANFDARECRVPAGVLLAAAHRLFSYDKIPFALVLIQFVIDQVPDHPRARTLMEIFTGDSVSTYPVGRMHRLLYDTENRMFLVNDAVQGKLLFKTLEEAERYFRGLK